MIPPKVVDGELLDQDVDVIANAWNRNIIPWWLLIPQGVSCAIKRHCETQPFREITKTGPLPLSEARLTSAGRLPHKGIINVAGISMLWRASEVSVQKSVRSPLELAEQQAVRSIAIPTIGAGTGGLTEERGVEIMLEKIDRSPYRGQVRVVRFRTLSAAE